MSDVILVLDAGSCEVSNSPSTRVVQTPLPLIRGKIAGIGHDPVFSASGPDGTAIDKGVLTDIDAGADHEVLVSLLLDWSAQHLGNGTLVAVGHRVVHGGTRSTVPL